MGDKLHCAVLKVLPPAIDLLIIWRIEKKQIKQLSITYVNVLYQRKLEQLISLRLTDGGFQGGLSLGKSLAFGEKNEVYFPGTHTRNDKEVGGETAGAGSFKWPRASKWGPKGKRRGPRSGLAPGVGGNGIPLPRLWKEEPWWFSFFPFLVETLSLERKVASLFHRG